MRFLASSAELSPCAVLAHCQWRNYPQLSGTGQTEKVQQAASLDVQPPALAPPSSS